MPGIGIPLAALPKRTRPENAEHGNEILAYLTEHPDEGYGDGTAYATDKEAQATAATWKRHLSAVTPAGKVAGSRTFPVDGGFGFAVILKDAKEKASKKSKS